MRCGGEFWWRLFSESWADLSLFSSLPSPRCPLLEQVLAVTNPADSSPINYSLDSLVDVERYEVD